MQSECDCEIPLSKSIQNKRFRVYRPHGEASPSTLDSPVPYASPQRPPLVLDAVSPKSETVIRRHEGRDSSDPVALETCQRVLLETLRAHVPRGQGRRTGKSERESCILCRSEHSRPAQTRLARHLLPHGASTETVAQRRLPKMIRPEEHGSRGSICRDRKSQR